VSHTLNGLSLALDAVTLWITDAPRRSIGATGADALAVAAAAASIPITIPPKALLHRCQEQRIAADEVGIEFCGLQSNYKCAKWTSRA
jgi:hypothetical protein